MKLIRKLKKSIEGLVQVGLSIGLHHVTEVMLVKYVYKKRFSELVNIFR